MNLKTAALLRNIFLGLVIVLDIAMLVFWWLAGHYVFFWVFIGINIIVLIGEVVNYIQHRKTISTQITHVIRAGGSKKLFSYLAAAFMALTLIALFFHFVII